MVENIPLAIDAGYGTVIVSTRIIHPVINNITPVSKRTGGGLRSGICQPTATFGGINHIIGIPDFPGRAGFKKQLVVFIEPTIRRGLTGNKVFDTGAVQHFVHVFPIDFRQKRAFKSTIYVNSSVIIH